MIRDNFPSVIVENFGIQSPVQRCERYSVLHLQTCQDPCVVQGTAATKSKLREQRQEALSACFVAVPAINKPVFLAGSRIFLEAARYRAVFLAEIENNYNFTLSRKI